MVKKFFTLLLCIALLFLGCASGMQQKAVERAAPDVTEATVEYQVQGKENFLLDQSESFQGDVAVSLSSPPRVSTTTAIIRMSDMVDDITLFTRQIQETSIFMPEIPDAESQINGALQKCRAASNAEADELSTQASDAYTQLLTNNSGWDFYGYSYYTLDTVTRLDAAVFSMTTYYSSYTGGAHPNNTQAAFNFNVEDGTRLSLGEILLPEGQLVLKSMILGRLQTKANDFGLFDEYESIVEERFQPSALATQVDYWYFSDTGLVIFFNPYDILPYAAGVVKIEFSYEDLSEFLKSEFIPVALNSDAQAPAPILRFPANTDMEAYQTVEYVDAATTDSDVTFAMYGSNTVYNLSLSLVDWVEGQPFLRQSVYTANYLSDANLVIVQADVTTDRGNICLQYDPGNGTTQHIYFGLGYEDGSYHWITE